MFVQILVVLSFAYSSFQVTGQQNKDCGSDWKLIFRAASGVGNKVYSAWTRRTPTKNCTLDNGCLPEDIHLSMMKPPNSHLTSPLIAKWSSLKIKKVKLELFSKGNVVVDMTFNGTGSSSTNWFTRKRLLENSFDDLYSDGCLRQFTMSGNYAKRFLIAQESYLCSRNYYYWMSVVDYKYSGSSSRFCNWERHSSYPVFLYAPKHHKSKFYNLKNGGYATADILAISIKTEKPL